MQIYLHMQMHMNNEYEYTYADACVYTVMAAHIYMHIPPYVYVFTHFWIHKYTKTSRTGNTARKSTF